MSATLRDWILLFSLGLIWGASFTFTTIATADFGVLTLAAGRLVIGAGVLSLILRIRGERLPGLFEAGNRRFWVFALASALVTNAFPFTFLSFAQRYVDSSFAGVTMASVPLFVLPLAHMLVPGERMTVRRCAGFALGFTGILILFGPEALSEIGGETVLILAQLACLATAFCYALGSIVAKLAPQVGLLRFGTAALLLAAVLSVPLALVAEGLPAGLPSAEGMGALVYLGLLPTGLATLMLLSVIASAGPGFLSLVNYLVPVWAVVFGVLLLGESLTWQMAGAVVMIFSGLAVSQGIIGIRRGGHARG